MRDSNLKDRDFVFLGVTILPQPHREFMSPIFASKTFHKYWNAAFNSQYNPKLFTQMFHAMLLSLLLNSVVPFVNVSVFQKCTDIAEYTCLKSRSIQLLDK